MLPLNVKAQGISINTIIIALIGLLVLVILVIIVSGNVRDVNTTAGQCATKGGECVPNTNHDFPDGCPDHNYVRYLGTECEKNGEICCIRTI